MPAVWRRHIVNTDGGVQFVQKKVCSMALSHQDGGGILSVQMWVYIIDQLHHQHGQSCAVQNCHNCSGSCWQLYLF